MAELSFAELLELLGHDGFTAVCQRPRGGVFQSSVVLSENAPAAAYLAQGDIWFGVNPVVGPVRINSGRGTAAEVVRLSAVFADLDVKPGGVSSLGVAGEIIEDVSMMLGTRPSAIVLSGHGLQPYWPLTDGPAGGRARALLRRFGRLVAHVAEIRGGRVDPVYDLARVLRVPGTWNYKSDPVAVTGIGDTGRPLEVGELDDALTAYGVVELPGDVEEPGQRIISAPVDWRWGARTCNYAVKMMDGWAGDAPAARHPWLIAQATRIAAAHRHGCFDPGGYDDAVVRLVGRFRDLLGQGSEARREGFGEIADALAWGQALAAAKTDAELAIEIGGHSHDALSDITWAGGGGHPFESSPESASQDGEGPTNRLRVTWASQIPPKRVRWLWEGRIAQGTLSLLAGREGLGKSTLAYHLAGEVTRGLLPGEDYGMPRVVLVCANEDSWAQTIVPRLIAAGADLSKVARIDAVIYEDVSMSVSLPRDNHELELLAVQHNAGLLILDPLMSVVNERIDTHRDREVRTALEPLVALGDRSRMSILGLIHHNKNSGGVDPLNMVMASKAFTAVARSVHTCIADPDDETEERRLFATTKNNLGRLNLPVLGFGITGFPVETADDGTAWTGKLHWTGEVEGKMQDIMSRVDQDRGATTEAADWLGDYLHNVGGTAPRAEIERAGKAAGHATTTLKRAKERLKITHRSEGFPRRTFWDMSGSFPVSPAGPTLVPQGSLQSDHVRPNPETRSRRADRADRDEVNDNSESKESPTLWEEGSPGETLLWSGRAGYPNSETVGPVSPAGPASPGPPRVGARARACSDPSHTPLIKAGRWTCPDCP